MLYLRKPTRMTAVSELAGADALDGHSIAYDFIV